LSDTKSENLSIKKEGTSEPGTPYMPEDNEKTEVSLAEPLNAETVLHKPNEKTQVEEEELNEEKEKTLVEDGGQQPEFNKMEPLSILSYDLNLSDDFSSLVNQFKDLKVSPIESKTLQNQNVMQDLMNKVEEKVQLEPIIVSATDNSRLKSSVNNTPTTPRAMEEAMVQSRRGSVSSKRSQKSTKSGRSGKSGKSTKSARRQQNEKKLQHQQPKQPQKYVERSYDEMMRIPDIYERLAFYEKTLHLCLEAESPISKWRKYNNEKGKPQPLLEGYVPPVRTPEMFHVDNNFGSMSSTFSGSISMFLKKAGSQSTSKKHGFVDNKSILLSSSQNYTAPNRNVNQHYYGTPQMSPSTGLFGRSFSRLNLSRSTQIPRNDQQLKMGTPSRMAPPMMHNRVGSSPRKASISHVLSPLSMDYKHQQQLFSTSSSIHTPRSSASTPTSLGSSSNSTMDSNRGDSTGDINPGLSYMMNILPQIDVRILQNALDEAKGDPMVAISIAVGQSKKAGLGNHQDMKPFKNSNRRYNRAIRH
jgi:hypothetical protein